MKIILLFILVSAFYSCDSSNTNTPELKQLNERITRLEQRMDSLAPATSTRPEGIISSGTIRQTNNCAAITKKGTRCKRKAKSNGYCWQHGK